MLQGHSDTRCFKCNIAGDALTLHSCDRDCTQNKRFCLLHSSVRSRFVRSHARTGRPMENDMVSIASEWSRGKDGFPDCVICRCESRFWNCCDRQYGIRSIQSCHHWRLINRLPRNPSRDETPWSEASDDSIVFKGGDTGN